MTSELIVNSEPVEIKDFIQEIFAGVVSGFLKKLKKVPSPIKEIHVSLTADSEQILVNSTKVPLNPYVKKLTRALLNGLLDSLDKIPPKRELITLNVEITE